MHHHLLQRFRSNSSQLALVLGILVALLILSLALSFISTGFHQLSGWGSFSILLLLAVGILLAGWWLLSEEHPPRWLGVLLVVAVFLRLAAGVFWFVALPIWGHGTPAEEAGYVMGDAYQRDQAAWRLASSAKPLWSAFRNNRTADQYGGLLFLSALIYRYLGGAQHQPLLILILTATFSSLAVLYIWASSRRAWGEKVAGIAAVVLTLYPEAILLGSSQMREAFTMTLTVVAIYGLIRYQQDQKLSKLVWVIVALLLFLPFSPPFAAILTVMLMLMALAMRPQAKGVLQRWRLWLILGGLIVVVMLGLWLAAQQFAPEQMSNPLSVMGWWLRKSAEFQAYLSKQASGWLQKTFKNTPKWMHLYLLLGFGILQPFLPAALIAGSQSALWQAIAIWRAVGWTFLLAFMIYAPFLAFGRKANNRFSRVLVLIVWLGILVAAFRGGGDLWDNPRYRVTFVGFQVALLAWAWVEHRRVADPWLRRAVVGLIAMMAWFVPWYLRRYTTVYWPVVDLFKTLGLGLISACLLSLWDWARVGEAREPK